MYLELSARHTGKTARLREAMYAHLQANPDNFACITVHSQHAADVFRKTIDKPWVDRVSVSSSINQHVDRLRGGMFINDKRVRMFWDEFDIHPSKVNVFPVENGYYAGTAVRTRTVEDWKNWHSDPLLSLIVANNFHYVTYNGMSNFFKNNFKTVDHWLKSIGADEFNRQFLCEFNRAEEPEEEPNVPSGGFPPFNIPVR